MSSRAGPLALAVSIFVIGVFIAIRHAMAAADGHLVYALDDAYIHMAMAKNFAAHGVWGCTPFHFSSSTSSPLWTFVLAAAYAIAGTRDTVPLVLNLVFAIATLVVSDEAMRRLQVSALVRAVALVALIAVAALPGMVLMGMEHVLHLLLTIAFAAAAATLLSSARTTVPAANLVRVCALSALLSMSRYEGLFLVAAVCLACLARRYVRESLLIGAAAAAPVLLYGFISLANGAMLLPNSLMLKAVGSSSSPLQALLKPIGSDDLQFFMRDPSLLLILAFCISGAMLHARSGDALRRAEFLLPLWLMMTMLLHGHFVFSSTFWAYRYDAYLFGFGVIAAAVTFATPSFTHYRLFAALAVAAPALIVLAVGEVPGRFVAEAELAGVRNTWLEHVSTAQFVREYYPGDTIVVNDLGAVTYFTNARILDAVGLGDVEPLIISRRHGQYTADDVYDWTGRYQPTFAIVQLDWSWIATRVPVGWRKVAEVSVPTHGQRLGFFALKPAAAGLLQANVHYHYAVERAADEYRVALF